MVLRPATQPATEPSSSTDTLQREHTAVDDGQVALETLRSPQLPQGMQLGTAKAQTLGAVWPICGALAAASDSDLRAAIRDGRLPQVGLSWLHRLHSSLSHLRARDEAQNMCLRLTCRR